MTASLPAGTRLGAYEILSSLGEGGMGAVYRARDARLNRDVAIKVLLPEVAQSAERLTRFRREAQFLAAFNHSNIAQIYGLEEGSSGPFLVLELVEGPTLADRIAAGPMSAADVWPIARQVAEALEAAHEQGIVHRDLKPANIKVRGDGTVKVLDFGLAKALDPASAAGPSVTNSPTITSPALTGVGVLLGTAAYMSPEQIKGRPADKRADVWAFGCVLFEMFTARPLFSGESVLEVIGAVAREAPALERLPSTVPSSCKALIARCLDRDPRRRLRDIGEARILFESAAEGPTSRPESAPVSRVPSSSRWQWIALGFAVVLVGVVAGTWLMRARQTATPQSASVAFEVSPPDKVTFDIPDSAGRLPRFALSPDGRALAYVGMTADGHQHIWVRSLDDTAPRMLRETDGADAPFWSPDSRRIAFFSQRKLKYVDVSGGGAQTIADVARTGFGAAWGADGTIVFAASYPNTGLMAIHPGSGVAAQQVTKTGSEDALTGHVWPDFLPDGQHFLYASTSASGSSSDVYVGALDGRAPVRLMQASAAARYTAGYLVFARENGLFAQRFDERALALAGEPGRIRDTPGANGPSGYLAVSVSSNGLLAYGFSSGGPGSVVWRNRAGQVVDRFTDASTNWVSLSADGRRIAFSRVSPPSGRPAAVPFDVWLADDRGRSPVRLTAEGAIKPVWSPDSRFVVFSSSKDGLLDQLFTKPVAGLEQMDRLVANSGSTPTDWSSDNRQVIFHGKGDNSWDVLAASVADHKSRPVVSTPFNEFHGALSADMRWLAYASDESGTIEVYVQPFPATGPKWKVSNHGGSDPRWRRDGKELFYISPDGTMTAVSVGTVSSFTAEEPRALFATDVQTLAVPYARRYDVYPDGQTFVLVERTTPNSPPITVMTNWSSLLK